MSNDESILSNASLFGTSGGDQTQIIKVLASVVETQKTLPGRFTTVFDRIEEARNESRRNVTALTEEIKKLEQRSSSVFDQVLSQLITQNENMREIKEILSSRQSPELGDVDMRDSPNELISSVATDTVSGTTSFGMGGGSTAAPAAAPKASVQPTAPVLAPKTLDAPKTETETGMTPAAFSFSSATTVPTAAPAISSKTVDSSKLASIFGGSQKTLFGTSSPSTPVDGKKAEVEKKDTPSSVFGSSFMGDGQTPSAFSALSGKPSIFDQQDKVAEGQKNFASLAKSKPFGQSATAAANEEDGEEGEQVARVIPLPDLVEVKTGEEDETVLFTARSKIFRYVRETKEYKERGVGELKLLHNETTNQYRVLMRRDQVNTLCANFSVPTSSKLMEKQGQSNVRSIVVTDFAENEAGDMESFCIKFKNAEVAKDFEIAFHDAQANLQ